MTNIPNIGKDTIVRTVAAALALLNSLLVMAGKAPLNLDESGLYEAISILAAAATTAWIWWKDNDIRKTTRLAKLQAKALQEEELRKLEAENGGLGSEAGEDPSTEEAADLS